jgi:hypothetical protein
MVRTILPAFEMFPVEAMLVGNLLAGYGELEYELTICTGIAISDFDTALRAIFRSRSESQRLEVADALMRPKYIAAKLDGEYADAIGAVRYCKKIRNQFAHCHWYPDMQAGLYFTNLEEGARSTSGTPMLSVLHVDPELLKRHELYFCYAHDCLVYLQYELQKRMGEIITHNNVMPAKQRRPSLHNPPEDHPVPALMRDHAKLERQPPSASRANSSAQS